MAEYEPWTADRGAAIIANHAGREAPLLPLLRVLQQAFGYIPEEAVPMAAHALNLTRAEVYGVVSFYHDFHRKPQGRHTLRLCRAEACQAMG
ncbi:MAG: NAD(P)H-dependent oxidoreductase subunit E, partial [Steroidobacteraceae bacterium]